VRIRRRFGARESGMVLVSSILLLVVVTVLAIGMFHSFGLDEKVAGNTREKQRALQAAVSAQQYAEWWLATGNATGNVTCTTLLTASITSGQTCLNTLPTLVGPANVGNVPWLNGSNPVGVTYQAPGMVKQQGLNITAGTYYNYPVFYISYLGVGPAPSGVGTGNVYQIDAVGYGGSPNTVAVVESTFIVQTVDIPLDNP
jgi:type IV pilus assembly protein PilX